MGEDEAKESMDFRSRLGITQERAATILGCSRGLVSLIEIGAARLGHQRRKRMAAAVAAFDAGGLEAVEALPPFRAARKHRTIPPEDREEMRRWREVMGLGRGAAASQLGLQPGSIDAIERGRMRITEKIRGFMEADEKAGRVDGQ